MGPQAGIGLPRVAFTLEVEFVAIPLTEARVPDVAAARARVRFDKQRLPSVTPITQQDPLYPNSTRDDVLDDATSSIVPVATRSTEILPPAHEARSFE